jgi:transcriptional regulator with XRE-family HTH domain
MTQRRKTTKPKATRTTAKTTKAAKLAGMTQSELARLIGVSQQRISQLAQDGTFQVMANGKIDPLIAVPRYIAAIKADDGMGRIRAAKAIEVETRNAKELGELISLEDVNYAVGMIVSNFCGELAGVAAASTRDLGLREVIQTNLTGAIMKFKSSLDAMADDTKAGKPIVADEAGYED